MTDAQLVVMLTRDDVTVGNACELFDACKALPVGHWGCKNVGLDGRAMRDLARRMKDHGKTAYLEVVTYDEASCLAAAKTAVAAGFDTLMGTVYHPSVHEYLRAHRVEYSPFVGKVSGIPSVLEGDGADMVEEARRLMAAGVRAFDLLAYRHAADGEALARHFCAHVRARVCIAGSVNSFARIDAVRAMRPWGFTIGSALFERRFAPGDFRANVRAVVNHLNGR